MWAPSSGTLLVDMWFSACRPKAKSLAYVSKTFSRKVPQYTRLREDCCHPPSAEHQDSLRLGLPVNRQNRILNERQTDFLADNNKASDSQDPKYSYHHRSYGRTAFACSTTVKAHTHTHSPAHHGTVLLSVGTRLRQGTREGAGSSSCQSQHLYQYIVCFIQK